MLEASKRWRRNATRDGRESPLPFERLLETDSRGNRATRPPTFEDNPIDRVRRREVRPTPWKSLRLGAATAGAGDAALPFPGIEVPEPEGKKPHAWAGIVSALLHAALAGVMIFLTSLVPEEEEEEIIKVQLIREIPVQAPDPAPARRAIAERRSVNFSPAAQAVAPQVVNPRVVAQAAPAVSAERLEIESVSSVAAPRTITRSQVAVETVRAVTSVAGTEATRVEVADAAAPALRGPISVDSPVGPSVGPTAVTTTGATIGTGPAEVREAGSSVLDGRLTDRDVLGGSTGGRLASVNTRVGDGHLRGPGGTGSGQGGIPGSTQAAAPCFDRPEVSTYMGMIRDRVYSRWTSSSPGRTVVAVLRFKLDVAGTARAVELVSSDDPRLGKEAANALRASSPFPAMEDAVRCLAKERITATFRLKS